MPAPGVPVLEGERLPGSQRTAGQVDTGLYFGPALRGPADRPIEIAGATEIEYWLGAPFGGSHLHRALIAFFADGGSRAYVVRPTDATAAKASAEIDGTGGNPVLKITADGPGAWANNLTLDVATGSGGRKLLTLKESGAVKVQIEAGSTEEAVGRLSTPGLVTVEAGSQAWPPLNATATAFTGGVSADSAVTDDDVIEALPLANRELGPCTLTAPGYTSATVIDALFRFARSHGHHALADLPNITDVAQLAAMGNAVRGLDSEKAGRYGQLLWPWEVVSIGPYLNVAVPPSGGLAGRMARTDRDHPRRQARAAAGPTVVSRQAVGVTQVPTDAEWDTLADAGITVIRKEPEGVCAMGAKTVVDGDRWPQYLFAAGHRTRMAIVDQARVAVRPYLFDALDGEGVRLETLRGVVENVCRPYSQEPLSGLFSENGDLGYSVTVTSTQAELAQGKVRFQLSLRTTPSIDMVVIEFTAVAIGDRL